MTDDGGFFEAQLTEAQVAELREKFKTAMRTGKLEVLSGGSWRDGMLHAIARLDRLAAAHSGSCWAGAYEAAAAALREELKIAEDGKDRSA